MSIDIPNERITDPDLEECKVKTRDLLDKFLEDVDTEDIEFYGALIFTVDKGSQMSTSFAGFSPSSAIADALMAVFTESPDIAQAFISKLGGAMKVMHGAVAAGKASH